MSGPHGICSFSEDCEMIDAPTSSSAFPGSLQPHQGSFADLPDELARPAPLQGDCSDERWEALKPTIDGLWNFENLTFKQVEVILRRDFNFYPTKRQFELKIKKWGFDKYIKRKEMAVISRKRRQRLAEGKRSEFYLRDREVPPMSIDRWESRHSETLLATAATPECLICFTPRMSCDDTLAAESQGPSLSENTSEEQLDAAMHQSDPFTHDQVSDKSSSDQLARLIFQLRQYLSAPVQLISPHGDELQSLDMTESVRLNGFEGPLGSQDGEGSQQEVTTAPEQMKRTFWPFEVIRKSQNPHVHMNRVIELSPFPNNITCRRMVANESVIPTQDLQRQKLIELKRKLDKLRTTVGPESPRTLRTMIGLSFILRKQGKYTKAKRLLWLVAMTSQRLFGLANYTTLAAYVNYISILARQGRFAEADELLQSTLSATLKLFDPEHEKAQYCMHWKSHVLILLRNYDEAEEIQRSIVQFRLIRFGIRSEETLLILKNLSVTLKYAKRYNEAEELLRVILQLQQNAIDILEEDIYQTVDDLTFVIHRQGRSRESLELIKEAVVRSTASFGVLHESTLKCNATMARCLRGVDKFSESAAVYRQTFERHLKVMGPGNWQTLEILENLAATLWNSGSYHEAAKCFKKVLDMREKIIGLSHPRAIVCCIDLQDCYVMQGLHSEALLLCQKILHMYGRTEPDNGTALLTPRLEAANELAETGHLAKAHLLYRDLLEEYLPLHKPQWAVVKKEIRRMCLIGMYELEI